MFMKSNEPKLIRNIAVVGHGKSGKTSFGEAMLFDGKATDRLCRVDLGESVLDFEPEEKDRKVTINSSFHHINWNKHIINIVDTPGDANFVADTFNSLQVVDGVILVIDASSGVQVITEKLWHYLKENEIPTLIFINKLDRENTDYFAILENIKQTLKINLTPLNFPVGSGEKFSGIVDLVKLKGMTFTKEGSSETTVFEIPQDLSSQAEELRQILIENIAESNEELLEKYLDGQELTDEEIIQAAQSGVKRAEICCVMCGSALKNHGVRQVTDFICSSFPSPLERRPVNASNTKANEDKVLEINPDGPLFAYVFKTFADPYAGKLTLFRVFSGSVSTDDTVYNASRELKEKFGQILKIEGKAQKPIDGVVTGDIAAVAKLKETATGDTFCAEGTNLCFKGMEHKKPVVSYAVFAKTRGDEDKMAGSFSRIMDEDPTIKLKRNEETKEFILSGVGQVHLDVAVAKLKRKFGVEIEMRQPKIPYKETIKGKTKVQGKHKKQTGGRGQFADTWIEIEPLPSGGGFEFVDKIVGGAIPKNYIPAVEKGIVNQMKEGILAGYPIVDLKVTLYDGGYHDVDSSDMAFQIAGAKGFKKGFMECHPILLEPIMLVSVTVPEEMTGDIMGDMNSRRGRVLGMEQAVGGQLVKALVPLSEMLSYSAELTSMTSGRGMFEMEFDHYEEVPAQLTEKIIAASDKKQEE